MSINDFEQWEVEYECFSKNDFATLVYLRFRGYLNEDVDYLNNFVRYYVEIRTKKEGINDCTKVCDKIESMIKESNNTLHKQKLLLIYILYNCFLAEEYQVKDWYKFLECNEKIFDTISVESIIVHLLTFFRS